MTDSAPEAESALKTAAMRSRAAGNWTRAITRTDKAIAAGKSAAKSMKAERKWMLEYRRLGGRLPVRAI